MADGRNIKLKWLSTKKELQPHIIVFRPPGWESPNKARLRDRGVIPLGTGLCCLMPSGRQPSLGFFILS
jgi:hypothetical protein